jgi:hypothetical protein
MVPEFEILATAPDAGETAEFLAIDERHFAHLSKRKGRYRVLCRLADGPQGIACDDAAAMLYVRSSGAGAGNLHRDLAPS